MLENPIHLLYYRPRSLREAATHQQEWGTESLQLDVPNMHAEAIICMDDGVDGKGGSEQLQSRDVNLLELRRRA